MQSKYDITIIVPVYNNEEYVEECVQSILNQNYDLNRIQVLLINDGSKDNSLSILKKYETENIIVIDKENSGVSDTRNLGLKKALGKYILFLDSDDTISKDTCKSLFDFFEKHYDEIDMVTYPIIYNHNGKLTPHFRYNNMYEKGTAVYDLEKHFNLIQTTVNVFIKNFYDENILFDVKQNFSEDERFDTEVLMRKKKIGFCKEATYYYRRHTGTANDTITNAYYSFELINGYYEYLFKKYSIKGKIPKYIQALYLNNVSWRIRQDDLYPYHYDEKKFDKSLNRIKNLLKQLDMDVILSLPYMNVFHIMYILHLREEKITLDVRKGGGYQINCQNKVIAKEDFISNVINKFRLKGDTLMINGSFHTIAFEVVKPHIFISIVDSNNNVKNKEIDTYVANSSYYGSKIKTNRIYGFKLKMPIENIKEIKMYAVIDNVQVPIKCSFTKFAANKTYGNKRVVCKHGKFKITNNSLMFKILDSVKNFFIYLKKSPKALIYRSCSKFYIKNSPIWIYSDKGGLVDNAYYQFKHDIKKNDGVKRYYIYDEAYDKIKKKFEKNELKCLVKFKSWKHKMLFIRSDKIISSFSDLQVYCPFNKGIKWYRDLTNYDFIYMQHGILHANLITMYSKEFTEIDKFVISSSFERENLIKRYSYDEDDLIISGMARMGLKKEKVKIENKILYAPSWREYLIGNLVKNRRKLKTREFLKSNYFKRNYSFLHSTELNNLLEENNLILEFKLHPIFKEYGPLFKLDNCKNINLNFDKTVIEEYTMFITDFSSFQFDFVNLKRPIIYFVPDMAEFKAGLHTYRELDLDYKDAFGNLCLTSDEIIKEMKRIIENKFKVDAKFKKRMDNFFLIDKNPCEKIYKEITK